MTVDIAKLRELLAMATPRPWRPGAAPETNNRCGLFDADHEYVARTDLVSIHNDDACESNASLIAAAVNALPELLAVYEAACAWGKAAHEHPYGHRAIDLAADCLLAAVDAARKAGT